MAVRRKEFGFTIVELLTAVVIIAMLIALLIPAIGMVRKIVKETQQKAQFTTIDLALTAFKGDWGDYPPSNYQDPRDEICCGAQNLAEALMGQDLLGFHPDSVFRNDGYNEDGSEELYPDDLNPTPGSDDLKNLQSRRGPYLELATANVFRLGKIAEHDGLFDDTKSLDEDAFVICDVFGIKKISLADGEAVKAGSPILYYKANTSSKRMRFDPGDPPIYNHLDNIPLLILGKLPQPDPVGDPHELADGGGMLFYDEDYKLIDPKVDSIEWPYRPDSYILISAGADSEYGTEDDICNF